MEFFIGKWTFIIVINTSENRILNHDIIYSFSGCIRWQRSEVIDVAAVKNTCETNLVAAIVDKD
ncbi:hypothetical protein HanXRQr2_Chr04g0174911 [Helianthus annuus]|uniref:Uncharacterized protein n=1 Tax=Helianthus annuus TaxID=4232 RepID=A0A9K3J983_HELAN|nr:hypothetical protein HanXRQr2_Chr04g0174911 [Helianthus annuus]KAJ0761895.1 hypothetical protein HanOQP8_Chr04g0155291 [Helianthus annuus]KAJ0932000.1 hypothetical protein HanPSC8_Chr04g0168531 [Helianthus annuus]